MGREVDDTLVNLIRVKKNKTTDQQRGETIQLAKKLFFYYYYYYFDEIKALLLVYLAKQKQKNALLEMNNVRLIAPVDIT